MVSTVKSCCNSVSQCISNTYNSISRSVNKTPAGYAEKSLITTQRTAAVALMIFGMLASAYIPITGGASAPFAAPLIVTGMSLLGLSLIQQALGRAEGCENGRITRLFAGIHFLCPTPSNWLIGTALWFCSEWQNAKACR
jgi:hypothetical protein